MDIHYYFIAGSYVWFISRRKNPFEVYFYEAIVMSSLPQAIIFNDKQHGSYTS